ncbi:MULTISPECIES: hypothetical protein [Actinokineospora]|uniref:Uncharacterized protein n=1 Tax=Actinokineospora fastidiosa TaxID=1816 RepID=A0A918G2K7_9PSEU|nr:MULTISPECIES: hypothetical protein [Actinokineospora]UVS76843.1 hypothetical protein Actkin_00538 [Actinokineospora sp. UTMC 2448]GGS15409.1 hypothetical protein GCM10010171_04270 [Actinokineospora fastidiosa]
MTSDPLDQITLSPRRFAAVLASLALLLGLVLAIVPVWVAGPDPGRPGSVNCGNAVGGVETAWIVEDLGHDVRVVTIEYIAICEQAVDGRGTKASLLFLGGLLGIIGLGVVRRPASPGSAPPSGPAPA